MISLQRLEGFYWVAKTGGYARAARAFPYPITEPGVHQQVRRLEADVGARLFERVAKDQMRLTAAGRVLFDFVAPFLQGLPSIEQSIRTGTMGGTLRVCASQLVLRHLLPRWVRRLQTKRPDIRVELQEVATADLSAVRSGDADVLVDYLPRVPEDISVRKVATNRAFLALPAHHPLAQRKRLSLRALEDTPFIGYTDPQLRDLQLRALASDGGLPVVTHAADSADTILAFVAAGVGYSLVPSPFESGPKFPGVVAHRLRIPETDFPVYAAWRKHMPKNPLLEEALSLAISAT